MSQLDARMLGFVVRAHFDPHTLAKGRVYQQQRRVQNCAVSRAQSGGWLIAADVRGSQAAPYSVGIQLSLADAGTPVFQGTCSCPMMEDCKHVAAVFLHVLEKPERWFNQGIALPSDAMPSLFDMPAARFRLDHEWDGWLRAVERSARAVSGPDGALGQSGLTPEPPEEVHYILRPQSGRLKLDRTGVRRLKACGYGQPQNLYLGNVLYNHPPPPFVRPGAVVLARKAMLAQASFNAFELF